MERGSVEGCAVRVGAHGVRSGDRGLSDAHEGAGEKEGQWRAIRGGHLATTIRPSVCGWRLVCVRGLPGSVWIGYYGRWTEGINESAASASVSASSQDPVVSNSADERSSLPCRDWNGGYGREGNSVCMQCRCYQYQCGRR